MRLTGPAGHHAGDIDVLGVRSDGDRFGLQPQIRTSLPAQLDRLARLVTPVIVSFMTVFLMVIVLTGAVIVTRVRIGFIHRGCEQSKLLRIVGKRKRADDDCDGDRKGC